MSGECFQLNKELLNRVAETLSPKPSSENGANINNNSSNEHPYACPSAATSPGSETVTGTPHDRVSRGIKDFVRSINERAKGVSPKIFWHEEDSIETASSCMNFAQDGLHDLPGEIFMETEGRINSDAAAAAATAARTLSEKEVSYILKNSEHLCVLQPDELRDVMRNSLRREYLPGEVVLEESAYSLHACVVIGGEVEVFSPNISDTVMYEKPIHAPPAFSQVQQRMSGNFHADPNFLYDVKSDTVISHPRQNGRLNYHYQQHHRDPKQHQQQQQQQKQEGRGSYVQSLALQEDYTSMQHCGVVKQGMIFGLEACVLRDPSPFRFVAGHSSDRTVLVLLPFPLLQQMLERNRNFAQSVGHRIGEGDVFIPVREFCRYVFMPTEDMNEYLPLWTILDRYMKIENVIHTKLTSNDIDTAAWSYAVKRLPENVTTTFCFNLVLGLPPFVATRMREEAKNADVRLFLKGGKQKTTTNRTAIKYIPTKERRRCTWHLGMEGKSLVLLRDGFTDLLDFLSMLCVHIIESNKLRGRIQGMVHPPAIDVLDQYLRNREEDENAGIQRSREEEMKCVQNVLKTLPLSKSEQEGLLNMWETDCLAKIYEVMMHREEFNVRIDPSISRRFQTNPFLEWAINLRACILQKIGMGRNWAPPDDLYIDIVSSNTHCIKNLLSSFHRKHYDVLYDYAKRDKRLGSLDDWHTVEDALYAATTSLLATERPDLKEDYASALEDSGITVLADTAMTGLQVDIIPVHAINFETVDSVVLDSLMQKFTCKRGGSSAGWGDLCKPRPTSESPTPTENKEEKEEVQNNRPNRHFIINMDFAFGAQAEGICRAIFSVFGHRIRSVNVIGKAGGLIGKRGDIQLPKELVMSNSSLIMEDPQDELRRCRNQGLTAHRLRELAGENVSVHEGRLLTIAGTMLQNVRMLEFYKHIWGCVGAEMEGSYFARVIENFYRQGVTNPNLETRFAYYTSDLPLLGAAARVETPVSLSAPMTPAEGVPPLYAIARGILENVLLPQ